MLLQVIPVLLLLLLWELNLAPSSFCRDPAPLPNNYQAVRGKCEAWLWYIINTVISIYQTLYFGSRPIQVWPNKKMGQFFWLAIPGTSWGSQFARREWGEWELDFSLSLISLPPSSLFPPRRYNFLTEAVKYLPPILPWLYTTWKQHGKYTISGLPLWDKYEWNTFPIEIIQRMY